jgi:hypothetical protein
MIATKPTQVRNIILTHRTKPLTTLTTLKNMPQFYPNHVPDDVSPYISGYLTAAEWCCLGENGGETPKMGHGFTNKSKEKAARDVERFLSENQEDINIFLESGFSEELVGHNFYLNRNHHGSGFWDENGCDKAVLDRLSESSEKFGECNAMSIRGWIYLE